MCLQVRNRECKDESVMAPRRNRFIFKLAARYDAVDPWKWILDVLCSTDLELWFTIDGVRKEKERLTAAIIFILSIIFFFLWVYTVKNLFWRTQEIRFLKDKSISLQCRFISFYFLFSSILIRNIHFWIYFSLFYLFYH